MFLLYSGYIVPGLLLATFSSAIPQKLGKRLSRVTVAACPFARRLVDSQFVLFHKHTMPEENLASCVRRPAVRRLGGWPFTFSSRG